MSALKDRYVIPLTNFGFQQLFGSASNKILLKDFVNQVLPEEHQIRTFDYFTTQQPGSGEFQSRLKMARLMKQAGESLEKIRQYTGLSDQEIEPLI